MKLSVGKEERIEELMENSRQYVYKYIGCIPDSFDGKEHGEILLGTMHFTVLIAGLRKDMSKEDFLHMVAESWDYIAAGEDETQGAVQEDLH